MKLAPTAILFALVATPAAAQSVEVAAGDWSNIPVIRTAGDLRMSTEAFDRAAELVGRDGPCAVTQTKVANVTVPFLIEFGPGASVQRIVIRRMGCEPLETLMGGVVKELALAGQYKPNGVNRANWYRSEISFELR